MSTDGDGSEPATLGPDEAFTALGNQTRMGILQVLAEADDVPLSFSTLRERVGMRDSGQFNYHLDKLEGHFIRKSDAGYELGQAGRRVYETVLSGTITDDPVIERTRTDFPCLFCGAPIEMSYSQERLEVYCTECAGAYGHKTRAAVVQADPGYLGGMRLPPAGTKERTVPELLRAASTWGHLDIFSMACDVCPRCSATVEHSVQLCEHHDTTDGLCEECDRRHTVQIHSRCTNCRFEMTGLFGMHLIADPALLAFVAQHGLNPLADGIEWGWEWDEEILSMEPFTARFTLTIDDDALTLTVDDDLTVVNARRHGISESV